MKATVGRIVHYVAPGGTSEAGTHCAAIVTGMMAPANLVGLAVFPPVDARECNSPFVRMGAVVVATALYDDSPNPKPGTWHWPEREEATAKP